MRAPAFEAVIGHDHRDMVFVLNWPIDEPGQTLPITATPPLEHRERRRRHVPQ
jgi:hypothetical protein